MSVTRSTMCWMLPMFGTLSRRTSPNTSYPFFRRSSIRYEPSWPVAPVTRADFTRRQNAFARRHGLHGSDAEVLIDRGGDEAATGRIQVHERLVGHLAHHRHIRWRVQPSEVVRCPVSCRVTAHEDQFFLRESA